MPRYKITVEYDGTNLLGWQRQLDGPSAQEHLENALFAFTHQTTEICAAGRTDAGVHALAQVAHFDTEKEWDLYRLREAFNANLRNVDAPVVVLSAEPVSSDFHARFSAVGRGYIYRILNRTTPSPIEKNRVWWVPYQLDIEAMRQGAQYLLGHHDFSSFRAAACQAKSPLKTLDKLDIEKQGDEIVFTVEARSFLHHQVRNMVGTLKMVGNGFISPEEVQHILEQKDRKVAGPTAPACGLYLAKVMY